MKVIDDGIIKYDRSNFSQCSALFDEEYATLEAWRKVLYQMELIGEYPIVNIGYGNMSTVVNYQHLLASPNPQFVITGTQTGKHKDLDGNHYTRILDFDVEKLKVFMMGVIEASSEVLTHAAIYEANPNIKAVFHIHSKPMWERMLTDGTDYTHESIPYGTVEMARATQQCIANKDYGIFCMHGHEDGIVIYGRSLEEVGMLTRELYNKYILNH